MYFAKDDTDGSDNDKDSFEYVFVQLTGWDFTFAISKQCYNILYNTYSLQGFFW